MSDNVVDLYWRVGTHYGIHVYAMVQGPGDDIPVATFHDLMVAQKAVDEHNERLNSNAAES